MHAHTFVLTFALAAACGVFAPRAMAQRSPVSRHDIELAQRAGQSLTLTAQNDRRIETLSYSAPRALRVCNLTGSVSGADTAGEVVPLSERAIPFSDQAGIVITVGTRAGSARIPPGECYQLQAQDAQLGVGEPLAAGGVFEGSIGQTSLANPVPGPAEELASQLRQDDDLMRTSIAEFSRARRDLLHAAHELRLTSREESAVQRDERQIRVELPRGQTTSPGGRRLVNARVA
jgi:hypothetical protein